MTKGTQRKNEVIQAAGNLFYQQGYYKTSIADIANQCGLRKASIYHYVGSKQELALAVIESVHNYFEENIFNHAYQKASSSKERITSMFAAIDHYLDKYQQQYPILALTLEVNEEIIEVSGELKRFFSAWVAALAHILEVPFGQQANLIAEQVVAAVQGNLSLAKLYNQQLDLSLLKQHLLGLL